MMIYTYSVCYVYHPILLLQHLQYKQMIAKYNLPRNTIEINDFYLPEIINIRGEHKSSFLLQPASKIKSKKTVATRKNDWLNYTLLHKMSGLEAASSNQKNEFKVKNNYHPKHKCLTQERQDSKQDAVKELIIEKIRQKNQFAAQETAKNSNLIKNSINCKDLECQNFINKYFLVGDIKEKKKIMNANLITRKVKRYTSVCCSYNKSITEMIDPIVVPSPIKTFQKQFAIEPWNFSLDKENQ